MNAIRQAGEKRRRVVTVISRLDRVVARKTIVRISAHRVDGLDISKLYWV